MRLEWNRISCFPFASPTTCMQALHTRTHSFGCDVELRLKRNRIRIPLRLRLYANCRYLLRIKWTLKCLLRMTCAVCQTHVADARRKTQKTDTHTKQVYRELDRLFANLNAIAVASRIFTHFMLLPHCLMRAQTHTLSHTCDVRPSQHLFASAKLFSLSQTRDARSFRFLRSFAHRTRRNGGQAKTATIFAKFILTRSHSVFAPCARRTHRSLFIRFIVVCLLRVDWFHFSALESNIFRCVFLS